MLICKLCQNECEKYINAHILPRAFYESMRITSEKNKPFLLMSNTPGSYRAKSQIGIYDNNLVCSECEDKFKKCDNYAVTFFLNERNFKPISENNKVVGWVADYNYYLLKFFFITLLWRAGATNNPFFKTIRLGNHLTRLQSLILNGSVGTHQDYSIFLGRFDDKVGKAIILDPHHENRKLFDGLNFYRFYLCSGFFACIKVDNQPLRGGFEKLFLNEKINQLYVLNRGSFSEKKEFDIALDILDKNKL